MQLVRRPLAPGEIDHELLWLLVSLGGFVIAASWYALQLPWPICIFHALTGHPCATCGATRSGIAFFHGQFLVAWKWNPLAFVAYCALIIFDLYALWAVLTRGSRLRLRQLTRNETRSVRFLFIALLAGNWIYLLLANPAL